MQVMIFGGTGLIGKALHRALQAKGHEVLLRDLRRDKNWESEIAKVDAVVNLAGAPIQGKRWTMPYKSEIFDSRVDGTKKIVAAMGKAKAAGGKPTVLVNGSAVGFYGPRGDEDCTESAESGSDFLAFVCREWEEAAKAAELRHGIRTVLVRTGVVLAKEGGALAKMLLPFKLGLGGPIDLGLQWFPWIHLDDIVGLFVHALENESINGPLNGAAPGIVRQKEYASTLGAVLHRPAFIPTPGFGIFLLFGEVAEILTTGQKAIPQKTSASGYQFKHPELKAALESLKL